MINEKLQKWAEKKQKTLNRWRKEYVAICKKEGIKGNPIVDFNFNKNYIASVFALDKHGDYIFHTKAKFYKDVTIEEEEESEETTY